MGAESHHPASDPGGDPEDMGAESHPARARRSPHWYQSQEEEAREKEQRRRKEEKGKAKEKEEMEREEEETEMWGARESGGVKGGR